MKDVVSELDLREIIHAPLAQRIEQRPSKTWVVGSRPTGSANFGM